MTEVSFNVHTPNGRAITHLLEKSALSRVAEGLDLAELTGGGRTLSIHPTLEAYCSDGEASLLVVVESLAGTGQRVDLAMVVDQIDDNDSRALGEAILIASGFRGATVLAVA